MMPPGMDFGGGEKTDAPKPPQRPGNEPGQGNGQAGNENATAGESGRDSGFYVLDAVWNEAAHPRKDNGQFGKGHGARSSLPANKNRTHTQTVKNDLQYAGKSGNVSPRGANEIKVKSFVNKERHDYHINKHLKEEPEFAGMTEQQYVDAGVALLGSACENGIEGYTDSFGNIIRYDKKKNWFAVGSTDGIWSFYAPEKGYSWFLGMMRKARQHGGK